MSAADKNEPREWGPSRIKIEPELTSVKVLLTDAEVLRRARMAGEARRKAAELEDEKKRAVGGYKARIEQATATAVQYEQHVQDGYYTELTECPAVLVKSDDARHGWMVEIMHPTAGDVVSTRDPSPAELSMAREPRLPLADKGKGAGEDDEGDDDSGEDEDTAESMALTATLAESLTAEVRAGHCTRQTAVERLIAAYGGVVDYRAVVVEADDELLLAHLALATGMAQQRQPTERMRERLIKATGLDEAPEVRTTAAGPAVDVQSLLDQVRAGGLSRDEAVEALLEMHGGVTSYVAVVEAMATADLLRLHLELVTGTVSRSEDKRRLRTLIKAAVTG